MQTLMEKASEHTQARNAKTMTTSHLYVTILFFYIFLSFSLLQFIIIEGLSGNNERSFNNFIHCTESTILS